MSEFTLVMANINYSSWSVRPWLVMKHWEIPFDQIVIPLRNETTANEIAKYSPSGKTPLLIHNDLKIWDSLAICEYLADIFQERMLWPLDIKARSMARSISAEMHSGFLALRKTLNCNCRAKNRSVDVSPEIQADIDRITSIWRDCRKRFADHGDFLFGQFSIADAMYAPVVSRFTTYGIKVDDASRAYMNTIWSLPEMKEWLTLSQAEPYTIEAYERG